MVTVLIRTAIIYIMLLIALRLTGKRQLGELQVSELITTLMISELATIPIQNLSIPLVYSIFPIIFILCIEIVFSFLATKSKAVKKLFFGNPSIIIEHGVINQKELERLRIGLGELIGELRLKDVASISDVDYAILEQNGKLSVILKSEKQPICSKDMNIKKSGSDMEYAIIIDGEIDQSNLERASKSYDWLTHVLKKRNLNISEIFLMTINDQENINIINKEEK